MAPSEQNYQKGSEQPDNNLVVRVPRTLRRIMDLHVARDTHVNVSDFVREAIRTKLMLEAPDLYAQIVRGE